MFRDLEILTISRIVRRETRPWFVLFYEAIWAKFVYDSIGHNIPIKASYVFYPHPKAYQESLILALLIILRTRDWSWTIKPWGIAMELW